MSLCSTLTLWPATGSLATPLSGSDTALASEQHAHLSAELTTTDLMAPPASLLPAPGSATTPRESTAATPRPRPASATALGDNGPGVMQVLLSLGFIVGLLLLTLWLLKRLTHPQSSVGLPGSLVRVISATPIGQRERVVVVEVADTWLVLGVASGHVSKLHEIPRQDTTSAPGHPATMQDFANRLKQLLGARHAA